MTRTVRKYALIAGGTATLLIAGLAVVPLVVDVNQYRGLIQAKAEEALGRKVTLGPMSLSVFPSVAIKVGEPVVEGLMKARSLQVNVRLLPLIFGGGVSIKTVEIHQAEITLTRRPDGRWDAPGAVDDRVAEPVEASPPAPTPFALSRLKITEASIHLIDQTRAAAGRGAAVQVDCRLDLTGSVSRSDAGDLHSEFDAHLTSAGLLLDARGTVSQGAGAGRRTRFDLTVDQAGIDIAKARELTTSLGQPWPLPEGILRSPSLKLGGRAQGETGGPTPAEIVISDLVVHGADLALARDAKGRWNFDALTQPPSRPAGDAAAAARSNIVMKNLRLAGANVALHDEATGGAPVDLAFGKVNLLIEEYAPGRPLVMQLESTIEPGGAKLALSGTIPVELAGTGPTPIDIQASLSGLDARTIAPYLVDLLDLAPASGTVGLQAKLAGTWPAQFDASGSFELDELRRIPREKPIDARADFTLTARDAARLIQFSRLDATVGRSRVEMKGTLDRRGPAALVDLEIPSSSIDGADLGTLLALAGAPPGVEISSGQPVRIQARMKGDTGDRRHLLVTGSVEVADLTFRHPTMTGPLTQVQGRFALGNDGFDLSGFSGVIGGSDIAGTMSLVDFEAPRVTFALTSRHADFWELMSFVKDETPGGGGKATAASRDAPADDFTRKIDARGTLAIGAGSFGSLAFSNLTTTLAMRNKVVTLDPVAMSLYDGTMNGSATLDMSRTPPVYSVVAETAGVDTNALLAANLQMKDTLTGTLTGRLSVTASGAGRDEALANARGSGTIRIANGHVGGLNVLKVLSKASDLLGEKSLKEVSGRLAREGTDFSDLSADLKIAGGKVISERLTMISSDLELKDDGELNMMSGTIRVAGQIIFSQALSDAMAQEKSKAVDYFWDAKRGRVNLPITLAGPVTAPTPNIDWRSASGRLAERKVKEALGEKLKSAGLSGLLGGDPPREPRKESAAPPASVGASELSVAVEESGFSGNLLAPDLRIKGTLRGTGITEASVRVADTKGKLLHEESLTRKVEKFYASHDRAAPAAIAFRVQVEGAQMAGLRTGVRVVITVRDASGRVVEEPIEVSR